MSKSHYGIIYCVIYERLFERQSRLDSNGPWLTNEPWWPNGHRSCLPRGRLGFDPQEGKVDSSGIVSINHSLTRPRCKNGTSKCKEDRIMCASPVADVWRQHNSHSPQGDGLYQSRVGSMLGR